MDDKQILKMLHELVKEIDYDIYKEYFVYEPNDEDEAEERYKNEQRLIAIVRKHIQ